MVVFGSILPASVQDDCPTVPREIDLIERIQRGEKELLPELLAPHLPRIKTIATFILRDPSEAEDVVQDTVLKVMQHLGSIRSSDCFGHWVQQIARNAARSRLRKGHKHLFEQLEHGEPDDDTLPVLQPIPADTRQDPLASLEQAELRGALVKAVATLQTNYREVWELAGDGESGIAETARTLGISEANAMSRLRRARRKLRELLAPVARHCAICDRPLDEEEPPPPAAAVGLGGDSRG